jgi:Zn-dependent protease
MGDYNQEKARLYPPFPDYQPQKTKIWLNLILFVATFISTYLVGLTWSASFIYADVVNNLPPEGELGAGIFFEAEVLILAGIYVLVLLGILSAHELGHFLTCRHYRLQVTLPYFIPAPTLIGTLGAFIKIKSPITRKQQLFDIGVAGPLTSFFLSLPALAYGLSLSRVVPTIPSEGSIVFGEPLILKIITRLVMPDIPPGNDIILHPIAFAGWVGILVTAFNLFPVGQLDGGHVIYALIGPRARRLAPVVIVFFLVMGLFFWMGWLLWAVIIFFLGLRHPRLLDEKEPLSYSRKLVGWLTLIVFILSFIPDPIKGYTIFDFLSSVGG